MIRIALRIAFALVIFALSFGCVLQGERPALEERTHVTFRGVPGVLDVPAATTVPSGAVDLGFSLQRDLDLFPTIERQGSFVFALGFFDFLTIAGRGVKAEGPGEDLRDLSASIHARVLKEGEYWPSVALGMIDAGGGAVKFHAKYLTVSKSAFDLLRATVGYGTGTLEGFFAGLEVVPLEYVSLLADYDGQGVNAGLRLFPVPRSVEAYGVPRPSFDVAYDAKDDEVTWQLGLRYVLGEPKFVAQRQSRDRHRYAGPEPRPDFDVRADSLELAASLVDEGFENVSVEVHRTQHGFAERILVENRRFNRDAIDGLGVVAAKALQTLSPPFDEIWIVAVEGNLQVAEIRMRLGDLRDFLNDVLPADSFAERVWVTNAVSRPADPPIFRTEPAQRSWLKLDVFLRPGIETLTLTEVGIFDYRLFALPNARMQLWAGADLDARLRVPLYQSDRIFGGLGTTELDRVLLHQAFAVPLDLPVFGQLSVGRFDADWLGLQGELLASLFDGPLSLRATVARVGREPDQLTRTTALFEASGHYAPWGGYLSASGGLFLDGDAGARVTLGRFFGSTEIAAYFRSTTNGNLAGLAISLPLTTGVELAPWRVRPRLPDVFSYSIGTTVATDKNYINPMIGRSLQTDHDLGRIYFERDRWIADRIKARLEEMKSSIRWLVEPSYVLPE
ncbi:MAG: YjbH domain-containing protein [Deltaproteobacteria bacterium]|nr:YjbH domain-containing protein [Deltaproteobacteria bacterium]